jgi:toxin HigB-1
MIVVVDVQYTDDELQRLEIDPRFSGGFSQAVVKAFRKRMQAIRAAPDERVFYQLKSLHFEKLKGNRRHQCSMRLNDQYRLVMELREEASRKTVIIMNIEDYH